MTVLEERERKDREHGRGGNQNWALPARALRGQEPQCLTAERSLCCAFLAPTPGLWDRDRAARGVSAATSLTL